MQKRQIIPIVRAVAPLVGAWIEIARCVSDCKVCKVAPLVGAWIEITKPSVIQMCP